MLGPSLELVIILALIVFNGVLALSEMALVSARKVRLQQRAAGGDAGAATALAMAEDPTRFLSTVQIGITLVGILAGAFGGATLAGHLATWLEGTGLSEGASATASVALVVLAITYLSLIVGELVPKRLALQNPERLAARTARPMRMLSTVATPAVAFLSFSTNLVLRILGVRPVAEAPVSEEEVKLLIKQSTEAGVFEAAEQEMVTSIFKLGDRSVADLMTPRMLMSWIDIDDPLETSWKEMRDSPHTLFPVCQGGIDNVIGVVSVKDVWAQAQQGQRPDLCALMRVPVFVPENMGALRALEIFRQSGTYLVIVVDEYGGTAGLVTVTDVLEAIVGDLPTPEEVAEPAVVQRADGSWLLDGMLSVDETKDVLGLRALPDEDEYQTLAGFVLHQLGRIPRVAEHFTWDTLRFEVVDMDGNRVDRVLVSPDVSSDTPSADA